MKTPKLFHLAVLLVFAVALFFFPTPAEAVIGAWLKITGPHSFQAYTGPYTDISVVVLYCGGGGFMGSAPCGPNCTVTTSFPPSITIKSVSITLSNPGEETISECSGYCGCEGKQKKVSTCGGFYIPKRAPRSPAVPVSFKGQSSITSANITFKDLKYSLSLWLHHYDWGSGTWYGYLNTLSLPLGKHHGRLTTYVNGVRGGGCATGGFKVVDE